MSDIDFIGNIQISNNINTVHNLDKAVDDIIDLDLQPGSSNPPQTEHGLLVVHRLFLQS